jgi:regulatory protein
MSEAEKKPKLSAFDRALRLLERRPHFRREVEQKLTRNGYERDEIAAAVARLAELGYLDDAVIARGHATVLAERRQLGALRIRQELARRGAAPEAVATALDSLDPDSELERAREAARKWTRRRTGDAAALARHLDRKGFTRRVIFTVSKELAPYPAHAEGEPFADE